MQKYRHMSKFMPKTAPQWMRNAAECGAAVLCEVWNGTGTKRSLAYIVPVWMTDTLYQFMEIDGNHWMFAEPVKNPELIDEV